MYRCLKKKPKIYWKVFDMVMCHIVFFVYMRVCVYVCVIRPLKSKFSLTFKIGRFIDDGLIGTVRLGLTLILYTYTWDVDDSKFSLLLFSLINYI